MGDDPPNTVKTDVLSEQRRKGPFLRVLTSSWTLLACLCIGLSAPRLFPAAVPYMRPVGEGYGALLRMTVIPYAIASITSSLLGILRRRDPDNMVNRALAYGVAIFLAMLLAGLVSAAAAGGLASPSPETRERIGSLMFAQAKPGEAADNWAIFEATADPRPAADTRPAWLRMLIDSVPHNVFEALARGDMVKIVLFFVLFALTARHLPADGYDFLQSFFDGVFAGIARIMAWVFTLAAPGMGCLLAISITPVEPATLWRLKGFILLLGGSLVAWAILLFLVTWWKSGRTLRDCLSAMVGPLMMAMVAGKGVALPKVMEGLGELGFDSDTVKALTPVSLGLNPSGKALLFGVASIYCCNLYGHPITAGTLAILAFTVTLAAVSAVQVTPLVWYGYITIPLSAIGVPTGPILILLVTLDVAMFKLIVLMEVALAAALVALTRPNTPRKPTTSR